MLVCRNLSIGVEDLLDVTDNFVAFRCGRNSGKQILKEGFGLALRGWIFQMWFQFKPILIVLMEFLRQILQVIHLRLAEPGIGPCCGNQHFQQSEGGGMCGHVKQF